MGVVVGALLGYPIQLWLAKRADAAAQSQQLRADRVAAYSAFAEKVMDWRRSQSVRRELYLSPTRDAREYDAVSDENKRARAAAWTAYYRVRLLCGSAAINALAYEVIDQTKAMKRAGNQRDLYRAGDRVRDNLEVFLDAAAGQLGAAAVLEDAERETPASDPS